MPANGAHGKHATESLAFAGNIDAAALRADEVFAIASPRPTPVCDRVAEWSPPASYLKTNGSALRGIPWPVSLT